jgi:hypothetical protein
MNLLYKGPSKTTINLPLAWWVQGSHCRRMRRPASRLGRSGGASDDPRRRLKVSPSSWWGHQPFGQRRTMSRQRTPPGRQRETQRASPRERVSPLSLVRAVPLPGSVGVFPFGSSYMRLCMIGIISRARRLDRDTRAKRLAYYYKPPTCHAATGTKPERRECPGGRLHQNPGTVEYRRESG